MACIMCAEVTRHAGTNLSEQRSRNLSGMLRRSALLVMGHRRSFLPALLQKLVGEFVWILGREILQEIWREFCGIFSDPQNKGSKSSGKTSEHFSRENSCLEKIFRTNILPLFSRTS